MDALVTGPDNLATVSDAATELDVAVGIASWASGIEHQAARISVVAIFFEILSLP
ncbi:MAG: hypothetical protein H0X22_01850 [Acidimicrobiia bacterium]|nr:hypothetical protein [Acidimicrobiia bacterium]